MAVFLVESKSRTKQIEAYWQSFLSNPSRELRSLVKLFNEKSKGLLNLFGPLKLFSLLGLKGCIVTFRVRVPVIRTPQFLIRAPDLS